MVLLCQLSSTVGNYLQHAHRGVERSGRGCCWCERRHLALHQPQVQVRLCLPEQVRVGAPAGCRMRQQGLQRKRVSRAGGVRGV